MPKESGRAKMKEFKILSFFCILISSLLFNDLYGTDWPNWLGPNYNGAIEGNFSNQSAQIELEAKWEVPVGVGWSSPIISNQKVFLHDRTGNKENLTAYDLDSGKQVWRSSFDSQFRDDFGMENGPRSTPSVYKDTILIHSPEGLVHALAVRTGEILWSRNLLKDYNSAKGFFGRCSSPLILDKKVIFDVGGSGVGLVALSLQTGKTLWNSKAYGNDYASVVPLNIGSSQLVVAFMRQGLVVVDSINGSEVFFDSFQSPINASVNAASPLVLRNGIFLSSCYDVGAGYWSIVKTGKNGEVGFKPIWKNRGKMECHYSTPVAYGDYLFGFHGRQERGANLHCIKLSDGEMEWSDDSVAMGHLIRVGDRILCISENGEFVLFLASSDSFKPILRQQVLGSGRAHFAYSNGKIIARDKRRMRCLDMVSARVGK
jgi:outer membrane protein assembly factor BamB